VSVVSFPTPLQAMTTPELESELLGLAVDEQGRPGLRAHRSPLARDLALFAARGYSLDGLRAFDAFPMTHHFDSVALLSRL
jgi:hypothetical protein